MPDSTPSEGWPFPLPGEILQRQQLRDLADAMHFSLDAVDVNRVSVLRRARGLIGSSGTNTFTNAAVGYFSWNVDHLDNWGFGGRAITATQGPTLSTGLYLFTVSAQISSFSATYQRVNVEFERGGTRLGRRTLSFSQRSLRISAPVRVPSGAAQLVRVRVFMEGATAGSTISVARNNDEASPRLSWVQIANG